MLVIETYPQYYSISITAAMQRAQTINHSLSNGSESLKSFILAFRIERLVYPYFINRSARRFDPRTTIRWPCAGGKKLEGFILAFGAGRFHPCSSVDVLEDFILILLLETTGEKRKDDRA